MQYVLTIPPYTQHPSALLMLIFVTRILHFHHQRAASSRPIAHEESLVDGAVSIHVQHLQDTKTWEGRNKDLVQDRYIYLPRNLHMYVDSLCVNQFGVIIIIILIFFFYSAIPTASLPNAVYSIIIKNY